MKPTLLYRQKLQLFFLLSITVGSLAKLKSDDNDEKEDIKYTVTEEAWFDVTIKDYDGPGEDYNGRFTVGLFGDIAPVTALNFAKLAEGYKGAHSKGKKGQKLGYKESKIHRIVPDFIIQMGDITVGDGTGGLSIYGDKFNDENFILSHKAAGYVSMANHGQDTNASQFFILLNKARWLDGKHVVFGKVVKGMDVVRTIGDVKTDPNTAVPKKKITITDSGINNLSKSYDLTESQSGLDDLESD